MKREERKKVWIEIAKGSFVPVLCFVLLFFVFFFTEYRLKTFISEERFKYISNAFFFSFVIIGCFLSQRIFGAVFDWYKSDIASKTKTDLDEKFIPLFKRLTSVFIWIIALIMFLSRLGVNISALIAALGVSSLAIALAAQDTIANVIAGFLIMVDRPFVVADEIKLPTGEKAEVLEIGIRRSKFRSLDDEAIIIVPNLDLSKSRIANYTYGRKEK